MPKSLKRAPEGFGVGIYMGAPTGLGALNVAHREKDITRQIYLSWNFDDEQLRGVVDQVWELTMCPWMMERSFRCMRVEEHGFDSMI